MPFVGRPFCSRCEAPTALEVYSCDECRRRDFGFDGARAPLRYEGVGKELVHTLKYKGYARDVQKRGFQNQAGLMAEGVAERIGAPTSDKLKAVRRTRDQVELSAEARMGNVVGAYASRVPVVGRILIVDDVFTTGATLGLCAKTIRKAGAREVHALTLCRTV